uniref:Uncharacterized protein n=1 Tax=Clytia hemisphaerica TaxID=252671 RepID=A0A7M6DMM5_9CNID|eukprot:TCONS_00006387-protein
MAESHKLKKSLNVVHSDEIWKDHIGRELLAQRNWPQKWGFLSDIYKELEQETKEDSTSHNHKIKTPKEETKKSYPRTDAQMIGWKSAVARRNPYGVPEAHARGKCDILKTFEWPQEGQ